jgi:hypothetical protein
MARNITNNIRSTSLIHAGLCIVLFASAFLWGITRAQATIPPIWNIVADDFESGSLEAWDQGGTVSLLPGGGYGNSTGLAVSASDDSSYLYRTGVAKAEQGYVSFWFNPNGVIIPEPDPNWWPPGTSLSIAEVVNSDGWWPPLVALYVRNPTGSQYQAYLAWPINEQDERFYDYENGSFDLVNGWQQITIGYRIDAWVAVWLNGNLMRYATNVVDSKPYGDIIYLGKIRETSNAPSGTILFDDYTFQVPRIDDLWVDEEHGSDTNDGTTSGKALQTIQRAADLAGPGTTVHLLAGVYRETVWPTMDGTAAERTTYLAENGSGSVVIRGSEAASSLTWTALNANTIGLPPGVDPTQIYYADLSSWNLEDPPRFVVELDDHGEPAARLPLAREPDWQVATEWKTHEFWWAADGGSGPAACDPVTNTDHNCDLPSRSMTQLTDQTNDTDPTGIEPGNLTTLGNLTGATIVAIDTLQGHYVYRRTITAHNVSDGRVTVDRLCEHDGGSGNPGLGWGSKYYVEGLPSLLDSPGEWWYDSASRHIYLWPLSPGNPAGQNIEISRREDGFRLSNRSYITLNGLTIEYVNQNALSEYNWTTQKSYHNTVRNSLLRYANYGLYIEQDVSVAESAGNIIEAFDLEDSEVAYIDSQGIRLIDWWDNGADPDSFTHSGIVNTTIRGNEFHHLGFRTDGDNAIGLSFTFANQLTFEDNWVHHVAHNGVQFSESVIQSPKTYGFDPGEIKTGEILVKDNLVEKACQLTTDCGAIKFWGSPPDNHVFREVLITGNIFRDTFGWTYVSEKRQRWMGGTGSQVRGLGGFGLYVDHASGFHAYRNISYNNAYTGYMVYGVWRDGDLVYVNNVAANSLYGMSLGGIQYDTHGSLNTQVLDNLIVNNEGFGMTLHYADGHTANLTVDHNLYFNNGWRSWEQGGMWHAGAMVVRTGDPNNPSWDPYITLAEVQTDTPWETAGQEGDPALWDYNPADHALHDGSWPDFHLSAGSHLAIDQGVTVLPASLTGLLTKFDVKDDHWGAALDIGRYEAGFQLRVTPPAQRIDAGGTAHFTIDLYPHDVPFSVNLSVIDPSPGLSTTLSTQILAPMQPVTLTVTHDGTPGTQVYTLSLTGIGGGFTQSTEVTLLVGGTRLYLPILHRP